MTTTDSSRRGSDPSDRWVIRQAGPDDRSAALAMLRRAFGREILTPRAWDWAFLENPAGAGMRYLVAERQGRLIGQWPSVPTRLQHHGERIVALRSQNIATDFRYLRTLAERGGGAAIRPREVLASLARALAEEFGTDAPLSFGFPNRRSAKVLFGVGTVEVRPYPLMIRPVSGIVRELRRWRRWALPVGAVGQAGFSALAATSRIRASVGSAGSRRIEELASFGPWADRLWEELAPRLGTSAIRDAAFLNWRFATAPFDYRRFALAGPTDPTGFAVTATTDERDRRVVTLMELIARPGDRQGVRLLIDQVVRQATAAGAAGIVALATRRHPFRRELLGAGFLPARWAARDLCFTVRLLGHRGLVPNELFHIDDWHLSGADIDFP